MDHTWERWMDLLGRSEANGLQPVSSVPAYVIDGTQWTDDDEMDAKIAELRRHLKANPPDPGAPWIIVEHADGHKQVIWPA